MTRIECYLLEPTGEMTPYVDGVSSPVYRRIDTGALEHVGWNGDAPGIPMMQLGAMYRDSLGLAIRCPGGVWHPEQKPKNGAWVIQGTPPKLTIIGSILQQWPQQTSAGEWITPHGVRSYHAVLTDGVLAEC